MDNDKGVHKIENKSDDIAVSLHLYAPGKQAMKTFEEKLATRKEGKDTRKISVE